ncbi:MAG: TolC family protein [Candidatus Omnitrophica bacterium]|nr:TolC family protein [Candidatus Omnitrophota bacterium]
MSSSWNVALAADAPAPKANMDVVSQSQVEGSALIERINSAIQEAEKKLEITQAVAQTPVTAETRGPALETSIKHLTHSKATMQIMFPTDREDYSLMLDEFGAPFKETLAKVGQMGPVPMPPIFGKRPAPTAEELVRRASAAYKDQNNYVRAYELADRALELEPGNAHAQAIKIDVERELDSDIVTLSPYDSRFAPTEGLIAYKIASSDRVITLEEAVEIAVKNSVMLRSLEKRIRGAERKLIEAKRALFPTMNYEISSSGGVLAGQAYSGEYYKFNFSQPLFYGGELVFTIRQAEAGVQSDRLKYEQEKLHLIDQVTQAYNGVVGAEYNLIYQNQLFEEVKTHKERADKALEMKLVAPIEHMEIDSVYNQTEFQRESAETTLQTANLSLARALEMNLEETAPVDLSLDFEPPRVDLDTFIRNVRQQNHDIRIKKLAEETAYYAVRVFDAKKLPRVDLRGSIGMAGEALVDAATSPDLDDEEYIGVNVSMPFGANSTEYTFNRRFFAPTISSFLGSEDWRHTWKMNVLDKLSDVTDEDLAVADYLKAKAETQKEINDREIDAKEAYFEFRNALLQIRSSDVKVRFREKQVEILKMMTGLEENKVSELLNEMVSLAEDRYSRVTSISSARNAVAKMNRLSGIEGNYDSQQ